MSWWHEHGYDDLVSRVEIAEKVEWLLDWYREHPSDQTAEDALLDVLDVLSDFVNPRLQLTQRFARPLAAAEAPDGDSGVEGGPA